MRDRAGRDRAPDRGSPRARARRRTARSTRIGSRAAVASACAKASRSSMQGFGTEGRRPAAGHRASARDGIRRTRPAGPLSTAGRGWRTARRRWLRRRAGRARPRTRDRTAGTIRCACRLRAASACEIHRDHARLRPALAHRRACAAGAGAEIHHDRRRLGARASDRRGNPAIRAGALPRRAAARPRRRSPRRARERATDVARGRRLVHCGRPAGISPGASATPSACVRNGAWPACSMTWLVDPARARRRRASRADPRGDRGGRRARGWATPGAASRAQVRGLQQFRGHRRARRPKVRRARTDRRARRASLLSRGRIRRLPVRRNDRACRGNRCAALGEIPEDFRGHAP